MPKYIIYLLNNKISLNAKVENSLNKHSKEYIIRYRTRLRFIR